MKALRSQETKKSQHLEITILILDKMKILLMGLYKPPSLNEKDFLLHLSYAYSFFCSIYENITLIGDINMKPENERLNDFYAMNKIDYFILKPTCFKDVFPSTIDPILINHKQSFMKSDVYEIGISDHQKMIFSVLRKTFAKRKAKTVFYRCGKKYDKNSFNIAIQNKISEPDLSFEEFLEIFQSTLNAFAPLSKKRSDITTILS